jgi:hypothetical protein
MTALLAMPRHGWWLVLGGCVVLGIAAIAFSSHVYRCRCGAKFASSEAFGQHLHEAHRYE